MSQIVVHENLVPDGSFKTFDPLTEFPWEVVYRDTVFVTEDFLSGKSLTGGPSAACPSYAFASTFGAGTFTSVVAENTGGSYGTYYPVVAGQSYTSTLSFEYPVAGVDYLMGVSIYVKTGPTLYVRKVQLTEGIDLASSVRPMLPGWNSVGLAFTVPDYGLPTFVNFALAILPRAPALTFARALLKLSAVGLIPNPDPASPYTGGFFDGDSPDAGTTTYGWSGPPNASKSYASSIVPDPVVPADVGVAIPVPADPVDGVAPKSFLPLKLIDWSVIEDSTPVDSADTTGGTGQFTLTADETDQTRSLSNVQIDLIDITQGTTRGTIRNPSSVNGTATLVADSRMTLLSVTRTAAPFTGTLHDYFLYVCALVGITDGIVVDTEIGSNAVVYAGWSGVVWDQLKQMAIAQGAEMSLVSNNVVLRKLRGRTAQNYRDSSLSWAIDWSQMARSVEMYYYLNDYRVDSIAWPSGGWNADTPQETGLSAGEVRVVTLEMDASLLSVQQPLCVSAVDSAYVASSVYSVAGNDGLIVPPAQWAAGGGRLVVAIGEDTRTLEVTITASSDPQYAPYSIVMPSGTSDSYSSLRIVGTGVFTQRHLLSMTTGVNPDRVSLDVAPVVENRFITSLDQAHSALLWLAHRYGAPRQTVNVTTSGINRLGDTGSYAYPTFDEINALLIGMDFNDFNALYAGKTFDEVNAIWDATVADRFENQAFGNVSGARLRIGDHMYRIRQATLTPFGINYSAEEDTTADDFNSVWSTGTGIDFDAFNAEWAGYSFDEFMIAPLRRTN